jgi:hypothetical protein
LPLATLNFFSARGIFMAFFSMLGHFRHLLTFLGILRHFCGILRHFVALFAVAAVVCDIFVANIFS